MSARGTPTTSPDWVLAKLLALEWLGTGTRASARPWNNPVPSGPGGTLRGPASGARRPWRIANSHPATENNVPASPSTPHHTALWSSTRLGRAVVLALGLAIVLGACGGGTKSVSPSFQTIKDTLGDSEVHICYEELDPSRTFDAIVGATDARSYYVDPCPIGGKVAVGAFSDETLRDRGLRYLLGLDKASFTPDQSGPIWKRGWRLGTFAVVIAADTPPVVTRRVDRAMTALHADPFP